MVSYCIGTNVHLFTYIFGMIEDLFTRGKLYSPSGTENDFQGEINLHYTINCSFHRNNANSKPISKSIGNHSSNVIQANNIDNFGRGLAFFQRTVTLTRKYLRCGVTHVRGWGYEILSLGHVTAKDSSENALKGITILRYNKNSLAKCSLTKKLYYNGIPMLEKCSHASRECLLVWSYNLRIFHSKKTNFTIHYIYYMF